MSAPALAIVVRCAENRLVRFKERCLRVLRKPKSLVVIVVTLLSYGCPIQAIVHALELDERTVAAWRDRAGLQCQKVHEAIVEQGQLDLMHVQADEIRVKGRSMVAWMGLAMMVSTRLWLAGVVSQTRDRHLADRLLRERGAGMRSAAESAAGSHRRLGSVSEQYQASLPRKGEGNGRARKVLFTCV